MSLQQAKDSLKDVLGVIVVIVTLTYCGILIYCAVTWNEAGLAMFGGGFVAFAQGISGKFVDAELKAHTGEGATATVSATVSTNEAAKA